VLGSRYDVITVDSGDGMMGDSVARKIKEYSGTKIILNSVYNTDEEIIRDLEIGNYISKYTKTV